MFLHYLGKVTYLVNTVLEWYSHGLIAVKCDHTRRSGGRRIHQCQHCFSAHTTTLTSSCRLCGSDIIHGTATHNSYRLHVNMFAARPNVLWVPSPGTTFAKVPAGYLEHVPNDEYTRQWQLPMYIN